METFFGLVGVLVEVLATYHLALLSVAAGVAVLLLLTHVCGDRPRVGISEYVGRSKRADDGPEKPTEVEVPSASVVDLRTVRELHALRGSGRNSFDFGRLQGGSDDAA